MRKDPLQSVLIINIFGIGDVLFTTPLIANLKAQHPNVRIGYLCNHRTEDILTRDPSIDDVIVYDRDAFYTASQRSKFEALKMVFGLIGRIKNGRFDAVIDVSLNDFTGWVTWMAGIKRRIGYRYKSRGIFLNQGVTLKGYDDKHVIEYYLDLLEHIGIKKDIQELRLKVDQADTDWAEQFLARNVSENDSARPVGIVPGGGASWGKDAGYKRWGAEKYAKLADKIIENFSAPIILMGDKSEMELCGKVAAAMAHSPVMACGRTTVSQFAALARKCVLMIVNDGGPLHVAVAAGARTASIFGPVSDTVYGPYPRGNHIIIKKDLACQPCYRRFRRASCDHISCLNQLTVEEVFEQVQGAL